MEIGSEIGNGVGKTIQFGKNLGNKEYRAELSAHIKKEGKLFGDQVGKFGTQVMKAPEELREIADGKDPFEKEKEEQGEEG